MKDKAFRSATQRTAKPRGSGALDQKLVSVLRAALRQVEMNLCEARSSLLMALIALSANDQKPRPSRKSEKSANTKGNQ